MAKFLAFLGWIIIFGAIYTKDFNPHAFYDHLFKPKSAIEKALENPPDMSGRQLLIPDSVEGTSQNEMSPKN